MASAGIDFDTHAVHVVFLLEDGEAIYKRYELEGHDAFERARAVRRAMPTKGVWEDMGVIACAIEEPAGFKTGPLFRIQGAVLACLPQDLLVEKLMPSQWRKAVGLIGNAPKGEVALHAAKLGFFPEDPRQDAYDAFCLALAVSQLWEAAA